MCNMGNIGDAMTRPAVHLHTCEGISDAMTQPDVPVQTWGNIGDAMTRQGELQCEAGDTSAGQDAFGQAMQAFETACSMSSSEQGDDLPGLLHNWGVGLSSMANHMMVCSSVLWKLGVVPAIVSQAAPVCHRSDTIWALVCMPVVGGGDSSMLCNAIVHVQHALLRSCPRNTLGPKQLTITACVILPADVARLGVHAVSSNPHRAHNVQADQTSYLTLLTKIFVCMLDASLP